MMEELNKEVQYIKGVGPSKKLLLNKLGIFTLKDLITYYPRTYEDRSQPVKIAYLQNEQEALIEAIPTARVTEIRTRNKRVV